MLHVHTITNSRKKMKVIVKINYMTIIKIFGIIASFRTFLVIVFNFVYLLEATKKLETLDF